ncbi:MAG TPA: YXWGXW repeat-containing protein, partial [Chitinophagaceae bacterium]|nr:YXWGXW repeat-containing protein [Chitinophagaceae bacterium]
MKAIPGIALVIFITAILTGCGGTYVVSSRPSPPVYVRPAAPHAGYVWIDGNWYWRGGRYVYRQGYWAPPGRK